MVDAQLNLPLLQRHLRVAEVVNIGVREVVSLTEVRIGRIIDDPLGQVIELLVVVAHVPGVENMIVVVAVVEADKPHLHKRLDLGTRRVDHPDDTVDSPLLPVDQEEIREDLTVVENDVVSREAHDRRIRVLRLLRGEVHLSHELETVLRLVRAVVGECHDLRAQVRQVVDKTVGICVIEDLLDEVDRRLGPRMDLFAKVPFHKVSERLLALDPICIEHFLLL